MDVNLSRGSLAGVRSVGKRNWSSSPGHTEGGDGTGRKGGGEVTVRRHRLGRRDGKTVIEHLTEWLEDGIVETYIGKCNWGPENEHDGSKEGSLNVTNVSDEDMTQARWVAGVTLTRSWDRLNQLGVVTETTTTCLPNPLPPDFSIEDHLFECLERLKCWLSSVQEIHTSTFTEFLRTHFRSRWTEGRNGSSAPPAFILVGTLSKRRRVYGDGD